MLIGSETRSSVGATVHDHQRRTVRIAQKSESDRVAARRFKHSRPQKQSADFHLADTPNEVDRSVAFLIAPTLHFAERGASTRNGIAPALSGDRVFRKEDRTR